MSKCYATIKVNDDDPDIVKDFQRHYEIESAEKIAKEYKESGWTTFVFKLESMY